MTARGGRPGERVALPSLEVGSEPVWPGFGGERGGAGTANPGFPSPDMVWGTPGSVE